MTPSLDLLLAELEDDSHLTDAEVEAELSTHGIDARASLARLEEVLAAIPIERREHSPEGEAMSKTNPWIEGAIREGVDVALCGDNTYVIREGGKVAPVPTLQRLEAWSEGHHERSVVIERTTALSPMSWHVTLTHEHGRTLACERSFLWGLEPEVRLAQMEKQKAAGVVFATTEDAAIGLEATIDAALDAFDRGVWGEP